MGKPKVFPCIGCEHVCSTLKKAPNILAKDTCGGFLDPVVVPKITYHMHRDNVHLVCMNLEQDKCSEELESDVTKKARERFDKANNEQLLRMLRAETACQMFHQARAEELAALEEYHEAKDETIKNNALASAELSRKRAHDLFKKYREKIVKVRNADANVRALKDAITDSSNESNLRDKVNKDIEMIASKCSFFLKGLDIRGINPQCGRVKKFCLDMEQSANAGSTVTPSSVNSNAIEVNAVIIQKFKPKKTEPSSIDTWGRSREIVARLRSINDVPTVSDVKSVLKILVLAIDKSVGAHSLAASLDLKRLRIYMFATFLSCKSSKQIDSDFGTEDGYAADCLTTVMKRFRAELVSMILEKRLDLPKFFVEAIASRRVKQFRFMFKYLQDEFALLAMLPGAAFHLASFEQEVSSKGWGDLVPSLQDSCDALHKKRNMNSEFRSSARGISHTVSNKHLAFLANSVKRLGDVSPEEYARLIYHSQVHYVEGLIADLIKRKSKGNATTASVPVTVSDNWPKKMTYQQFKRVWLGVLLYDF